MVRQGSTYLKPAALLALVLPFALGARDEARPARVDGVFTTGRGGFQGGGERLTFPSVGTFRSVLSDCTGSFPGDCGRAVVRDHRLILLGRRGESSLTPVKWGQRQYLVYDLLRFTNDVNAGIEPREDEWGAALLRVDDWKKKVAGPPPLPPPWSAHLLPTPILGAITQTLSTESLPKNRKTYRAVVNLGRNEGVFAGMVLWWDEGRGADRVPVTVASVRDDSAEVEANRGPFTVGQLICSLARD